MILLWDIPHPLWRYAVCKHLPRSTNQLDPTPQKPTDVHFPLRRQSRRSLLKPECWATSALYVIIVQFHSLPADRVQSPPITWISFPKKTMNSRHQGMSVKLFMSRNHLIASPLRAIYKPLGAFRQGIGVAPGALMAGPSMSPSPHIVNDLGTCNRLGYYTQPLYQSAQAC